MRKPSLSLRSLRGLRAGALALAVLVAGGVASAVPITYEVEMGQTGGFQFSFIHTASSKVGSLAQSGGYYNSGSKLFELSGTMTGQFDAGVLTLDNDIELDAKGLNSFAGQDWTLAITGGTLTAGVDDLFSGSFDYVLSNDGGPESTSGTFYFDPVNFGAGPNTLTEDSFVAWGNNFVNGPSVTPPSGSLAGLGIDIGATGSVIPEPTSAMLYPLALAIGGIVRRHQRLRARIA